MNKPHTRNPSGVVKAKTIALRLLPEEHAQAYQLARESEHSVSALSRKAYLKGLPLVAEELRISLCQMAGNAACPIAHDAKGIINGNA